MLPGSESGLRQAGARQLLPAQAQRSVGSQGIETSPQLGTTLLVVATRGTLKGFVNGLFLGHGSQLGHL